MLELPVTSITAAIAGFALVVLSFLVSLGRAKSKVLIGNGEGMLFRRIRAQGNFVEYVPVGLILLGLLEASGAGRGLVIGVAVALGLGRASHAVGMYADSLPGRGVGSILTYGALLTAAGALVAAYV
jgi:uncharacterized protein